MIKIGEAIRVKTKTLEDVFGDVLYYVEDVGVHCPHCKGEDGIKFIMLGGSGQSARYGPVIFDCSQNLDRDIASGITTVIGIDEAKKIVEHYNSGKKPNSSM